MEDIQRSCQEIENETVRDSNCIINRLKSNEASKLSYLQQALDFLEADLNEICETENLLDNFPQHTFAHNNNPDVLRIYPEIQRVISKPLPNIPHVSAPFKRETAERIQKSRETDKLSKLLKAKDDMIWQLVQKNRLLEEQIKKNVEVVSEESSKEIEKWITLTDQITRELEVFKKQHAKLQNCIHKVTEASELGQWNEIPKIIQSVIGKQNATKIGADVEGLDTNDASVHINHL